MTRQIWLACAATLLAACAMPSPATTETGGAAPPLLLAANAQFNVLVVQLVESGRASWGNVSIVAAGDSSCRVGAPSGGAVEAGQHVAVYRSPQATCIVNVLYDGRSLGNWTFQPPMEPWSSTNGPPSTSTSWSTSAPASPPSTGPPSNGTVPP